MSSPAEHRRAAIRPTVLRRGRTSVRLVLLALLGVLLLLTPLASVPPPAASAAFPPASAPRGALTPVVSGAPASTGPHANRILATADLAHHALLPGAVAIGDNGPAPTASAYDPAHHAAYVITAYNQVLVLNESTHAVTKAIGVGMGPSAVLYAPGTGQVFVANRASSNVSIINDTSETVVATLVIPSNVTNYSANPAFLLFDPSDLTVLVGEFDASSATSTIAVIYASNDTLAPPIYGLPTPYSLQLNANNHLLYDLELGSQLVFVYNLTSESREALWSVPTPQTPTDLALDELSGLVFVVTQALAGTTYVMELDASNGGIIRNFTLSTPGAYPTVSQIVYAPATGTLYITPGGGEMYSIVVVSASIQPGVLIGACLGRMTLSGSGNPLLLNDACSAAMYWLDGTTAVVLDTTPVGAEPIAVAQATVGGRVAVAETAEARIDFLDGTTLAYVGQTDFATQNPELVTSDPATGWIYGAETSYATDNVTAVNASTTAVVWQWTACATCRVTALGDANGTILVSLYSGSLRAQELWLLNGTTGAAEANWKVAQFLPSNPGSGRVVGSLVWVPHHAIAVVSVPTLNETLGVSLVNGAVLWSRPTGTDGRGVMVLPDDATAVLGSGNGSIGELDVVNATTGAGLRVVAVAAPTAGLASDPTGKVWFVLEAGVVAQMNATTGVTASVGYPSSAAPVSLQGLSSGGVALATPHLGSVFWIGAPVSVSGFGPVGRAEQAEPLVLQVNASGGFGSYHYAYGSLPTGCIGSDNASISCTPRSVGPVAVTVNVTDATPGSGTVANASFVLAPYPLSGSIVVTSGAPQKDTAMNLSVQLPANASGFASYLSYAWAVTPASSGTFNRTNASTSSLTFTGSGDISIAVTIALEGTSVVVYDNVTVATGSTTTPFLSGTTLWLVIGAVAAVIVIAAAVVLLRRPRSGEGAPTAEVPPAEAPRPEAEEVSPEPEAIPEPLEGRS